MIARFSAWRCGCSDLTAGTPPVTCPGHDATSILLLAGGTCHFEELDATEAAVFGHLCGAAPHQTPCPEGHTDTGARS